MKLKAGNSFWDRVLIYRRMKITPKKKQNNKKRSFIIQTRLKLADKTNVLDR